MLSIKSRLIRLTMDFEQHRRGRRSPLEPNCANGPNVVAVSVCVCVWLGGIAALGQIASFVGHSHDAYSFSFAFDFECILPATSQGTQVDSKDQQTYCKSSGSDMP